MTERDRVAWKASFEARGCIVHHGIVTLDLCVRGKDRLYRWTIIASQYDANKVRRDLDKGQWTRARWYMPEIIQTSDMTRAMQKEFRKELARGRGV